MLRLVEPMGNVLKQAWRQRGPNIPLQNRGNANFLRDNVNGQGPMRNGGGNEYRKMMRNHMREHQQQMGGRNNNQPRGNIPRGNVNQGNNIGNQIQARNQQ